MVSTPPSSREIQGRLLIVTAGWSGLLHAGVELARRLSVAGHRVTCAGPRSARELVEAHDLQFLEIELGHYADFLRTDSRCGPLHRLGRLQRRRAEAIQSLALGPFVDSVRDLEPDLVLLDAEMHEQILAVSGLGVPVALLNSFPSIWRQPGLPPTHVMARPGIGWRGSRPAISAYWLALRLRKWRRRFAQGVRRVGCDRVSVLRQLAEETGFDFRRRTDSSQWLIPFTYRGMPYLSLHALEFEFPHQPPDDVRYIGPMVLESRIEPSPDEDERVRLAALLERRRSAGPSRLIYAGFGSVFSTNLDFVRRLIAAVTERPDWEILLSLSGRVTPADLGELPARAHVFSWVPQVRILQDADAVVTHGGINTIDECVLSGVPMLVYSGGETDMAGNTARVVHHGLGIAGDPKRDRTVDIGQHLDRLLNEPGFALNVSRLRKRYEAYQQNRVAERVVQSLLAQGSTVGAAANPSSGGP